MCIGLNQPAGNTAFKDSDKGQALKDGNIRRILHDEAAAICVKNAVQDCDACWNKILEIDAENETATKALGGIK